MQSKSKSKSKSKNKNKNNSDREYICDIPIWNEIFNKILGHQECDADADTVADTDADLLKLRI
jgi:hypothetical protein